MLQLKLSPANIISEQGDRLILSDNTGSYGDIYYTKNEDGTYRQETNTTGYGNPNLTRGAISLFVLGDRLGTELDIPVTFDNYSPPLSSSFPTVLSGDGIYKMWLVYANNKTSSEASAYNEGDVIYDEVINRLYKVEGGQFIEITTRSLINTPYSSQSCEFLVMSKGGSLYTELVSKYVQLSKRGCSERGMSMCSKAIDDIEHLLYSMEYEYCKGNKVNAVEIANSLNNKNYSNVLNM